MFDVFFRRGNPTNQWTRTPGLSLAADLSEPSLNKMPLGSPLEAFSFLGRSSSKGAEPLLEFAELGLALELGEGGTCSGFQVVFDDPEFQRYAGSMSFHGYAVDAANLADKCGAPYWEDRDEDGSVLFYEFPDYEIQVERSPERDVQRVILSNRPLLADAKARKALEVDRPWPPS